MNRPAKVYFSISEVCSQTALEPHVLRYWESEFSQLRPKKNRAGNRAYRAKDIVLINQIKHLLYEEKFTISGAKKRLLELKNTASSNEPAHPAPKSSTPANNVTDPEPTLLLLKKELGEVLQILKK